MTVLHGWGLAEQHLALDALVAFVDGELSPTAYDRAASHLAGCPACSAEAAAQRQARAAVRSAAVPSVSPKLLQALQSIPTDTELPGQPEGLALTEDGQLVTLARQDRSRKRFGSGPVLGSSAPLGSEAPLGAFANGNESTGDRGSQGRRTMQGAGVVVSGLVLGAIAFMTVPGTTPRDLPKIPDQLPDAYRNTLPASVHLKAPRPDSGGRSSRRTAVHQQPSQATSGPAEQVTPPR